METTIKLSKDTKTYQLSLDSFFVDIILENEKGESVLITKKDLLDLEKFLWDILDDYFRANS